jgi:hypothetical protein
MIVDSHNCEYLFNYPHQALAGGGMYAFHLPPLLPPPGSPGGPPIGSQFHYFPSRRTGPDDRPIFLEVLSKPERIPAIIGKFMADYQEAQKKKSGKQ